MDVSSSTAASQAPPQRPSPERAARADMVSEIKKDEVKKAEVAEEVKAQAYNAQGQVTAEQNNVGKNVNAVA
jgi:hypothetical protein